ncbi:heparinase II/III domain-containing protein [Ructibacterium gallinarum]|uniref:Heparinase II/III family protein n=1 Tax=Ructibacterium gallinarum TaxID=2779355 RepID=A0A9D5M1T2_9FIRM|nr:heparinase II/III family protein [Ructibacterium gallinarum]MBE5039119.1 heparinase II/III family protein [Ructibacterium gallinarum]
MNKRVLCWVAFLILLCSGTVLVQALEDGTAVYEQNFQGMAGFDGAQIKEADSLFSSIGEDASLGASAQIIDKATLGLPLYISTPGGEMPAFTDDLGDFSFFKSNYITHRYVGYPNTTLFPKSNEIICEKFDYKNPQKGDRIIFNKTTDEDCYIDVAAKIFSTYRSQKVYPYFKLSGEFRYAFQGDSKLYLFQLRENRGSEQVNVYPVAIDKNGNMTLFHQQTVNQAVQQGEWFRITMYLNLENHKVTLFLQGEKILDNADFDSNLEVLHMMRIQCRPGAYTGTLECRNVEFTGLDKPYAGQPEGEETRTSMFGDDQEIRDYLADKTAFHYYGKNVYSHGEKSDMTAEPIYENGELYVALEDFNRAYDCAVVLNGNQAVLGNQSVELKNEIQNAAGVRLVPVLQLASALLGQYVFDDTNGLILTAAEPLPFDVVDETPYDKRTINTGYIDRFTPLQYIYDFLLFDRPTREALLEDFNTATNHGEQHPRIMADADDFARIKTLAETDPYMEQVVNDIIKGADDDCTQSPIRFEYQDDLRTTTMADRLRDRMMRCGFAYQMTGEQKYVDSAWKNLNALNDFPDINPGHPIDTGSYGAGIAIGYDWFYDALSEEQRQNIRENALRLHLTVITEGFYGRSPVRGGNDGNINVIGYYNKWISNYNAWTNSGSLMMALAFMEDYPEVCSDLLWHSIRSLEYTFKNLYPDGSWVESTNYWTIVARSMAYVYTCLEEVYGTNFKLSNFPGTKETGPANLALRSMVASYNYHDCGEENSYANYPMAFLGQYFDQPELLAARKATLIQGYDGRMKKITADVFDALFYDPAVTIDQIKTMPRMYTTRGLEMFSVHEDYTDYDGLFVAAHGGPVSFYHSHNDNGDFVFDLNGVRWAYSLPAEDYNSSLPGSERYRMRTEGHNTITINNNKGMNQRSNTYAPLIAAEEGEDGAFGVYDLSESYADADKFLRGFYVGENYRSLTIRDEITLNKDHSEIYWFMHTRENAQVVNDHTVLLTSRSGNQSLFLSFETSAESAEISIMDAKPLPSSPQGEGQNPNTGVRKVAIRLIGSGKVTLTVRLGESAGEVNQTPIADWSVASDVPEPPAGEGDLVLAYGKEINGGVAAVEMKMDFSSRLGVSQNYEFCFDLYPKLTAGSFNFYLGSYYQLVYQEDGYTLRYRQKDDADFTEAGTYKMKKFIPIRIVVQDKQTADLYIDEELAVGGLSARDRFDFTKFGFVLNNGMKGNVYLDNLKLVTYDLSGNDLVCSINGDSLKIKAALADEYNLPRVMIGFYQDDVLLDSIMLEDFIDKRLEKSLPLPAEGTEVKVMLWDNLCPLSDVKKLVV